ncbi:unnamed protein product [Linum tenue]|uniref:Uncharacterized protein n=1 Tax=Linum tenue TaxID=586396 RepID=A0AAV0GYZ3_9ROSI|nr:unnamed protein product [Linum tenue]
MALSKAELETDESVHSTFASRYVAPRSPSSRWRGNRSRRRRRTR